MTISTEDIAMKIKNPGQSRQNGQVEIYGTVSKS
jgi:hypothetical protein